MPDAPYVLGTTSVITFKKSTVHHCLLQHFEASLYTLCLPTVDSSLRDGRLNSARHPNNKFLYSLSRGVAWWRGVITRRVLFYVIKSNRYTAGLYPSAPLFVAWQHRRLMTFLLQTTAMPYRYRFLFAKPKPFQRQQKTKEKKKTRVFTSHPLFRILQIFAAYT